MSKKDTIVTYIPRVGMHSRIFSEMVLLKLIKCRNDAKMIKILARMLFSYV